MQQQKKNHIEPYTSKYFAACGVGGALAAGITHLLVLPLDISKIRQQVGIPTTVGSILKGEGIKGMFLGWGPTSYGYFAQGSMKYGLYEVFKKVYGNAVGPDVSVRYRDALYMSASATAEFLGDIALAPFEAMKVRIQADDPKNRRWPKSMRELMPIMWKSEGISAYYKGLVPLWSRQIPYTVSKFWCFERTVEAIYKHVLTKPKNQYSQGQHLGVSLGAGYIAGVFCAVVSHPADCVVSTMNKYDTKPSIMQVLKELGPRGIWRGLGTRTVMIGSLTMCMFLIYDGFKVAIGLPTTGASQSTAEPTKPPVKV